MLVIYIDRQTNRLGYTINLLFKEILQVEYMVTTSREQFIALSGAKLSYCDSRLFDEIHITNSQFLFETNIYSVEVDYTEQDGIPKLFRNYGDDDSLGFDVFAAVFYMVSRYEEYLPFIRDKHSRFCASDSIAYKKEFFAKPVVNIWAELLKQKIKDKYPEINFKPRQFRFINTVDVDMAYSYKNKGFYRTVGGFLRDLKNGDFKQCVQRFRVLLNIEKDPYDCFDYLLGFISKYKLATVFFFLFSMRTKYDKNISPYNNDFQLLIKSLGDYSSIGIHPSYYSTEYPQDMTEQIKLLSEIIHKNIRQSRFHYLRFNLPESYRNLIENGIEEDYSMGYSDHIGFRAGICTPYNFYDLERDCETGMKVYPFAYMDVALKNGLELSSDEAWQKIKDLIDEVKRVNGDFISVWHNESLSGCGQWQGWRDVYEKQAEYVYNKQILKN
ncbi:MAG: polysaccharide deacetylase family protein [Bacteroidales bacterium]|nr:polysaccharide deacetylase family protein [Bacteroidales bacterium]